MKPRALPVVIAAVIFLSMPLSVSASDVRSSTVKEYPGETVEYEYEDGLLVSETSLGDDGVETRTTYQYIDGRLAMCTTVCSATDVVDTVFFIRSPSTYELVAIKRNGSFTFIADPLALKAGGSVDSSYVLHEDGTSSIVDGDREFQYSATGELVREILGDRVVEYGYEDGAVVERRTTYPSGSCTVERFSNGEKVSLEEFGSDGVIASRIVYGLDGGGMVKTIYSNGRPVADVHYKEDDVRVDRIEYL